MIEMNCLEQVYVCLCCHLYTDIQLNFCFVLFLLFFVVVLVFFLLEEEGGGSEHKIVKETGQNIDRRSM